MTSPAKLYPNADISIGPWAIFGGGTTNIYTACDNGTDSPDDSDAIASGANASASCVFGLTDTPSDFGSATGCSTKIRGNLGSTKGSYISQITAQLFKSDGTTALTNAVTQTMTGTLTTYTLVHSITGSPSKADWDGARIKFTTGSGSSGAILIYDTQVELPYTVAASGSLFTIGNLNGLSCGGPKNFNRLERRIPSLWIPRRPQILVPAMVVSA